MFPKAKDLPLRQGSGGPLQITSTGRFLQQATLQRGPMPGAQLPAPSPIPVGYFCLSLLGLVLVSLILLGPLGPLVIESIFGSVLYYSLILSGS